MWPTDVESLTAYQQGLSDRAAEPWTPPARPLQLAGCWVCFPRGLTGPGGAGDPAWCAVVVMRGDAVVDRVVRAGVAGAPYVPGLLALRVGALMDATMRELARQPDVLLVDATGRDHPRRAGLAVHLGAELDLPTVGVTHRPLLAAGEFPDDRRGATSPLSVDGEEVACWLRTRPGARPLVVHPGWRTDLATAIEIVMSTTGQRRTPEPLRGARRLAREARGRAGT